MLFDVVRGTEVYRVYYQKRNKEVTGMKRIVAIFLLFIFVSTAAIAEEIDGMLDSIIPAASIWGTTETDLKGTYDADYHPCQVNGNAGWYVTDIDVCSYNMDVYYVFDKAGLSRIAYILNNSQSFSKQDLDECFNKLVDEMKEIEGEPDSEKKNDCKWDGNNCKIEIGKGKMSKYTGSDISTVAIVFKESNSAKPAKTAKPASTPKPKNSGTMVKVKIGSKTVEIRKSFKDAMDGYETFFDKYIAFLKNPDMLRYAEIMLEYSETMESFERIDEDDLSTGELAYYTEVHARIMSKLSDID